MNSNKYILDGNGNPTVVEDLIEWAEWMEVADCQVAKEKIGSSTVSTVFLGLDRNFGVGSPVLWETMVFNGKLAHEMDRCSGSREQAEAMHKKMCDRVKNHNS